MHKTLATLAIFAAFGCAAETSEPKNDVAPDGELAPTDLGSADHASPYRGDVALDVPVAGSVSRRTPYHYYTASLEAGRTYSFTATGGVGDDLYLILYVQSGGGFTYYAHDDDCSTETFDPCLEVSFADATEVAVLVSTYPYVARRYPTAASYELSSTCLDCGGECPAGPDVHYTSRDPEECSRILFTCIPGLVPFFSDCGCGCAPEEEPQPECQVGGCSGQVCHEAGDPVFTTCEWRPEYACYQTYGQCERQPDDTCGWTPTAELQACLADPGTL